MPTVDDVQFDVTGWELREPDDDLGFHQVRPDYSNPNHLKIWTNESGDLLTKYYSPEPPQMPGLFRTAELYEYYGRLVAAEGGTIVSVELLHVKGSAVSRLLFKIPQPDGADTYVGLLTLAHRKFSYSICMQATDMLGDARQSVDNEPLGNTGLELHAYQLAEQSHAEQSHTVDPTRGLQLTHAASPQIANPLSAQTAVAGLSPASAPQSEASNSDREFPSHPLTRLRTELARLLPTLQISREVKNSVPHNA